MPERKLATTRRIREIQPIPGADLIVLAKVDGWQSVIKKDEYIVGDLVTYCEVDSLLPVKPEYEFLRKSSYKKFVDGAEGFRLKSMKLRKVLSQGLILPYVSGTNEGDEVTELLGITKYEPAPTSFSGDALGAFPSHLVTKTDEERVQNINLQDYENKEVYISEKLDGTSVTFYANDGHFGVCSRNLELKPGDNIYWHVAKELNLESILSEFGNIAVQGEIIGPGIQKNYYKILKPEFYVFNIFDLTTQKRFSLGEMSLFCTSNGLKLVPVINIVEILNMDRQYYLDMADNKSVIGCKPDREGLVFQSNNPHDDFSFKAISNKFLLEQDD